MQVWGGARSERRGSIPPDVGRASRVPLSKFHEIYANGLNLERRVTSCDVLHVWKNDVNEPVYS